MIGVPFFFDQHLNMRIAEENGFGVSVPYESVTLDKFQSAVRRLLEDPRFVHFLVSYKLKRVRIISDLLDRI